MALADVKKYYKIYEQMHYDAWADFLELQEGCKQGLVTQDQVDDLQDELDELDDKYQFFSYIMFLFSLPRRDKKKQAVLSKEEAKRLQLKLVEYSEDEVKLENEDVLVNFRNKINQVKEAIEKTKENNEE